MKPIERAEVLSIGAYEPLRERFRARVIEEKKQRRVALGEHLSAVFENRDTVLLQIQEMLRTERITREPSIEHEISTYNELIPAEGQLSLTLFVEIADKAQREAQLVALVGLEQHLWLEIAGRRLPLRGAPSPGAVPWRTTAVHYLKVALPADLIAALRDPQRDAALLVDHPAYAARAPLPAATRARLLEDLATP